MVKGITKDKQNYTDKKKTDNNRLCVVKDSIFININKSKVSNTYKY